MRYQPEQEQKTMSMVRDTTVCKAVVKQCKGGMQRKPSSSIRPFSAGLPEFSFAYDDGQFSDRVICFREKDAHKNQFTLSQSLHVNSMYLAGWSPYFKSLFSSGFRESTEKEVQIQVEPGQIDACLDVVRFVYDMGTSKSFQSASTVEELMNVILIADRFQIDSAAERAVHVLLQRKPMTLELCEAILALPDTITRAKWFSEVNSRIQKALVNLYPDLDNLLDSEDYLDFSGTALALILSSDDVHLKCENSVFVAVYRWFFTEKRTARELNEDSATSPMNLLLDTFRLPQMTSGFFLDVVRHFKWVRPDSVEFAVHQKIVDELALRAMETSRSDAVKTARSSEMQFRKRASGDPVELKAVFSKEEIISLEEGYRIQGQHTNVYGYSMSLAAAPESRDGDTFVRSVLLLNDNESYTSKDSWMEAECELEVQGFGIEYQRQRKHSFGSLAVDHKDLALGWYSLHSVEWDKVKPSDTLSICLRVKIMS